MAKHCSGVKKTVPSLLSTCSRGKINVNCRFVLRKNKQCKQNNAIFRVELQFMFYVQAGTRRKPQTTSRICVGLLEESQLRVLQIHQTSPQDPQIFISFFQGLLFAPHAGDSNSLWHSPQQSDRHHLHGIVLHLLYEPSAPRCFISTWNSWKSLTLTTDDITESNSSSEANPKFCARSLWL